jgi:hypothetical protein
MNTTDLLTIILLVLAIVFFVLDGLRVVAKFNWTPLGFASLTLAVLVRVWPA